MANSEMTPHDIKLALSMQFFEENRRCYGKLGICLLPVDDKEQERLDIQHGFFKVARGSNGEGQNLMQSVKGLHARPLLCNGPPRILDLGCGTCIWGIDMIDLYPGASVLAWDLSLRMQPPELSVGLQVQPQDITDLTWDLDPNSMDLIHMRLLGGCVVDWRTIYQNAFRHLKPGTGLFEHIEIDYRPIVYENSLPEDSSYQYWIKEVYGAYELAGKPLFPKDDVASVLKQLGFEEIQHQQQEIPFHPWPKDEHLKDIGRWFNLSMQSAIPAMSMAPLTRYARWSYEQVQQLNDKVKVEICQRPKHFSCTMHTWHAKKP